MKISEILSDNLITINLDAENNMEAIEELVDFLISKNEISFRNRDEILSEVIKREHSVSTGIGDGVAIPHSPVECVKEIFCAIGVSKNGINFHAIDNKPVYIVVLLLIPKTEIACFIKTMAHIVRIFLHKEVRDAIRNATSPTQVFHVITQAEQDHDL